MQTRVSGDNKITTGLITTGVAALTYFNAGLGLGAAYVIGKFGEDELSQRSIDLGNKHVKKSK